MHKRIIAILGTLILLSLACNLPAVSQVVQSAPGAIALGNLVTPDPNATPTPTPFQPIANSAEGTPRPETAALTPEPSATSDALIDRLPRPDGQVNILLLGSDFRPNSGYRTDVIMLVSLNPKLGTASVVSFPRDLYVYIPGWKQQRINTAQAHGGFDMTVDTFEYNFGVTPDHYIMTNFDGFKGIIDTLGGIDVYAANYMSDSCDLPAADYEGFCSISPGWVHMDGTTALWYVRARHTSSDFDRTRREQEVIQAIFVRLLNLNAVARAPELYNLFINSVETDLGINDILPLLPLATKLSDTSTIARYAVGPDQVTSWTTEEGAAVLLPNTEAIWDIIRRAAYNQP
ncbi:MAG TPA: LCP family protein [Anaerolineaceae bacterium]|jgi:LCP family protein required for cell wall assembly|nr:LCP family protein [Anaerolineaceae bacterium]